MRAPIVGGLAAVTCCTHFALFRLPYSSTTRISKTVALRLNGRSGAHMFRLWSVRSKSQTLSPPSPLPFRLPSLPYLHSLTPFHPLAPHSPFTPPQCQVISCASFDIIAETSTGQADFWLLCACVCVCACRLTSIRLLQRHGAPWKWKRTGKLNWQWNENDVETPVVPVYECENNAVKIQKGSLSGAR